MIRIATAALVLLMLSSTGFSQPWMDRIPQESRRNFYEIQKAFNDYWTHRDTKEKGKGWKPFKRWEWFWEQRVYPTGEFPDRMVLYRESARRESMRSNAGAEWSEIGPTLSPGGYSGLGRLNCVRTDPSDPATIWVGSAGGGLWKTTDGGTTWTPKTDDLPTLGVTDIVIDPGDTDIMYIATGDGDAADAYSVGVMKSTDGGETWETTGLSWTTSQALLLSRLLMHPDDPSTLIAAGHGVFKSTDAGATWVQTSSIRFYDLEFKPGDPSVMYASGGVSEVYRSTTGGDTWARLTNGFPTNGRRVAIGVTPANPEYIYALVSNISSGFLGVYRSTDGGDSWLVRATSPNLLGWNPDGSDAGGQGWYDLAIAVSPTDEDIVYTGGVNVWKSTNGGTSWTINTMWYFIGGIPNIHADQHNLWFNPATGVLYAANDGGIYSTSDNGSSWQYLGSGIRNTQFYRLGVSQTDPDRVIGGTQDNGTKLTNDGVWTDEIGGDGMEALIDWSDAAIMYGELYYGDIQRSMNGGITWSPITGGISESGGWITPYIIHPTDPATLFAGFNHVWKTTNRGTTWSTISNFAGSTLSLLAVCQSDPQVLYAGTGNLIYRTTDGGATNWTVIPRPAGSGTTTDIEIHPLDPDHIWVTSSGYVDGQKVYESTDAGQTWTNISAGLPNVPANCVLYQNNSPDRIYVGTDIGVFYRDLTSGGWIDYNEGLPNVVVTELDMQYESNKLHAATYGRGIWATDAVVNVGAVIGVSHSSVDFGPVEAGTTGDTVTVSLTNYGTVDTLTVTDLTLNGTDFEMINPPALPAEILPGESAFIELTFLPGTHGVYTDSLAIESNATNASLLRIPLTGKGIEIGQALPNVLYAAKDTLYIIDAQTGAKTPLGATGVSDIQSMAVHPVTDELYAVSSTPTETDLYRISGPYGDALQVTTIPYGYMRAITFRSDGTLYGAVPYGTGAGTLYEIDIETGDASEIGTSDVIYSSLAFSPVSGTLWASERPPVGTKDRIYTIDTGTGDATLVGQTGFLLRITAAIAFDQSGTLYGITGNGGFNNELITIDTETAAGTMIAPLGLTDFSAMAIRVDSVTVGVTANPNHELPAEYVLHQNYPNPFNPTTEIRYGLPSQARVRLTVYNMLGQEVATLMNDERPAGYHSVSWNGLNAAGSAVASGLYLYRLTAEGENGGNFTSIRKMLLLR